MSYFTSAKATPLYSYTPGSYIIDRGEAVNHGFIDAANLVKALDEFKQSKKPLLDAINSYEVELKSRNREAVLLSRQACLDAHRWAAITPKSPLVDRSQQWGK